MSRAHEGIAEYFRSQADWRAEKATEYPEDERNQRASDGLSDLADYVLGLPDDDTRIQELWNLGGQEGVLTLGSDAAQAISRFRFNKVDAEESCEAFLSRLVPIATASMLELADLAGEL